VTGHRRPKIRLSALFALAVAAVSLLAAETAFNPDFNPHAHFRNTENCPKCHLVYRGKMEPDRFSTEADAFCLGCHSAEALGRSHPRNVRPRDKYWKMRVPDDYRLDDDGRMICLTCHKGHGSFLTTEKLLYAQPPENPDPPKGTPFYYKTYFLRIDRPIPKQGFAVLCTGCHEDL